MLKEALNTIERINDDTFYAMALRSIIPELVKADMFKNVLPKMLRSKDSVSRSIELSRIASSLTNAGMVNEALTLIEEIKEEIFKVQSLVDIAVAQVKADLTKKEARETFNEALTLIEGIKLERFKVQPLVNIAVAQVKADLTKEARETFNKAITMVKNYKPNTIYENTFKSDSFKSISMEMARSNMINEALALAERVIPERQRIYTLGWIFKIQAEKQLEAGMFKEALATADRIKDQSWSTPSAVNQVLVIISEEQARKGMFKEALATANRIKDPSMLFDNLLTLNNVLLKISEEQVKAGLMKEARETFVQAIASASEDTYLIQEIAKAQTKAGMVNEAIAIVNELKDNYRARAILLAAIAEKQMSSGMSKDAWDTFSHAFISAERVEKETYRAEVLYLITESLVRSGIIKASPMDNTVEK